MACALSIRIPAGRLDEGRLLADGANLLVVKDKTARCRGTVGSVLQEFRHAAYYVGPRIKRPYGVLVPIRGMVFVILRSKKFRLVVAGKELT